MEKTLLKFIENEIDNLEYGRVTIEVCKHSNKIDIVTEKRNRFLKDDQKRFG